MNKTDMSNPAQYTAYLQAYVAQRRQISSDMPAEWRNGEMSGNEAEGRGGLKKTYPGQDLQECGQLRQSLDALNCRTTVNHWLEGLVKLHSAGSMSSMVILFQRKQSIKSLLRPLPALGSECNTNQWERKALWSVLEDRWYYVVCVGLCVHGWIRLSCLLEFSLR